MSEKEMPKTTPTYATPDEALSWKSPDPLQFDYTHSDTGQTFRIEGICKAKDRKAIYAEMRDLKPNVKALTQNVGYEPTDADITDACWAAACVTAPKLTSLQWLQFGAEASLGEVTQECLIASRIMERRLPEATGPTTPDGELAAEQEMNADPT